MASCCVIDPRLTSTACRLEKACFSRAASGLPTITDCRLQHLDAEARALFERLLSLRNDVGLLAEEYDPKAQRQLGNFPQAFSHLALIGTALSLHDPGPAQQRSQGAKPGA